MFVAFFIGSFLGYLLIDKLIFKFIYVYHPPIGVGAFVTTLIIILASCLGTVGYKIYKAAVTVPVKTLRNA